MYNRIFKLFIVLSVFLYTSQLLIYAQDTNEPDVPALTSIPPTSENLPPNDSTPLPDSQPTQVTNPIEETRISSPDSSNGTEVSTPSSTLVERETLVLMPTVTPTAVTPTDETPTTIETAENTPPVISTEEITPEILTTATPTSEVISEITPTVLSTEEATSEFTPETTDTFDIVAMDASILTCPNSGVYRGLLQADNHNFRDVSLSLSGDCYEVPATFAQHFMADIQRSSGSLLYKVHLSDLNGNVIYTTTSSSAGRAILEMDNIQPNLYLIVIEPISGSGTYNIDYWPDQHPRLYFAFQDNSAYSDTHYWHYFLDQSTTHYFYMKSNDFLFDVSIRDASGNTVASASSTNGEVIIPMTIGPGWFDVYSSIHGQGSYTIGIAVGSSPNIIVTTSEPTITSPDNPISISPIPHTPVPVIPELRIENLSVESSVEFGNNISVSFDVVNPTSIDITVHKIYIDTRNTISDLPSDFNPWELAMFSGSHNPAIFDTTIPAHSRQTFSAQIKTDFFWNKGLTNFCSDLIPSDTSVGGALFQLIGAFIGDPTLEGTIKGGSVVGEIAKQWGVSEAAILSKAFTTADFLLKAEGMAEQLKLIFDLSLTRTYGNFYVLPKVEYSGLETTVPKRGEALVYLPEWKINQFKINSVVVITTTKWGLKTVIAAPPWLKPYAASGALFASSAACAGIVTLR